MLPALKAGPVYFAIVFAAGVLLGAFRALAVAPLVGETAAVVIELPAMLAVSWFACRTSVALFAVPQALQSRLAMGALAFILLLVAELGLSVLLADRTVAEHVALYRAAPALLGLAGQIAFALFPAVQRRSGTGAAGAPPSN